MKFILFLLLILGGIANAQTITTQEQACQNDLTQQNSILARTNNNIASDNACIAYYNNLIAQANANSAQSITGVNWDYYDALEIQGDRFATFSTVTPGVNWPNITSQLNITCVVAGGESAVNWNNWTNCESKGVNGGSPIGQYSSGWTAFYCGKGSIAGTC